jgi:hypothetical protein
MPTFLETQLGHKTRLWCILKLYFGLVQNSRLVPGKYDKMEYQILASACIKEGILVDTKTSVVECMI